MSSDKEQNQCLEKYKDLMERFQFRSHRAALMNYNLSAKYDKIAFWFESSAGGLGVMAVCLLTVRSFLQTSKKIPNSLIGGITALAGLSETIGKGSASIPVISSFQMKEKTRTPKNSTKKDVMSMTENWDTIKRLAACARGELGRKQRAQAHNKVASLWQRLEYQAESYLKQMNCRCLEEQTYIDWYQDLIVEREKACAEAFIDKTSYKKYTAEKTTNDVIERDKMFNEYKNKLSAKETQVTQPDDDSIN